MYSNFTKQLLNLEDVKIKKITHTLEGTIFHIETVPKAHICPCCGLETSRIHDYRFQKIKDLPFQLNHTYLLLKKRRYVCSCGKKFYEHYSFLAKYQQRTTRLTHKIAHLLRSKKSFKDVASDTNISTNTVTRILDTISYGKPRLPQVLSIDEFKGNTGGSKYQCILVDAKKKCILDILPDRKQNQLIEYFRSCSKDERYRVKFFISDMWQPYVDLAKTFFPNATIIIDKYHFIRQVTWAIEKVRKRLQKSMTPTIRKYYKRSRKLILTRYKKLKDENKRACDLMLTYNDDLRLAHTLKEWFYDICQSDSYSFQRTEFWSWIKNAETSSIKEFEECAKTYRNWAPYILNAFKYGYTNGPTEGFNNKIKVLKRISFGLRNFERFRTRIIHCSI